jgi:hypothetical protein
MHKALGNLGTPDVKLAGLQIWIHGREFPKSRDYWDGNWLRVTAHCGADGASVVTSGSIIHLDELQRWLTESEKMHRTLRGEASLECIEPELNVRLRAMSLGRIAMEVEITPNNITQQHSFEFEIDQSYLAPLIEQCRSILEAYPIRGRRDQ